MSAAGAGFPGGVGAAVGADFGGDQGAAVVGVAVVVVAAPHAVGVEFIMAVPDVGIERFAEGFRADLAGVGQGPAGGARVAIGGLLAGIPRLTDGLDVRTGGVIQRVESGPAEVDAPHRRGLQGRVGDPEGEGGGELPFDTVLQTVVRRAVAAAVGVGSPTVVTAEDLPGVGTAANRQRDRHFRMGIDVDRTLIAAAFLTPLWGWPPGTRPIIVFTADGRGHGKTTCAELIGYMYGCTLACRKGDESTELAQRILSPEGRTKCVILIDNLKDRAYSSQSLEGLITARQISGRQLYVGEASRPNHLTYIITVNSPGFSTDIAQRAVIIRLGRPDHSGTWLSETQRFIDDHRDQIIADMVGYLRRPRLKLRLYSRWADWDDGVLSHFPNADTVQQTIILRRREKVHVQWLHTIGNLTLTGYNPTLSNKPFSTKQVEFANSKLSMSSGLAKLKVWDEEAIRKRGEELAKRVISLWPRPKGGDVYAPVAVITRPAPGRERRESFWEKFIQLLTLRKSPWLPLQSGSGTNLDVSVPANDVSLVVQLNRPKSEIRVRLQFERARGKQIFDALLEERAAIESDFQAPLLWGEAATPEITAVLSNATIRDPLDWLDQHEWIADRLAEVHRGFYQRLEKLNSVVVESNPHKQLLLDYWAAFERYIKQAGSRSDLALASMG